ncbi:FKBP-type peptidyl-prolyl cis-trans isomerase [Sphingomonas psychrotolerans]|uniref:Peptidyl-prolyl cis-trans isomerase n=1 Tax=Sphingomonas psychrotolerans TaxID=1327635 RepID=A0ABU3N4X8_9SPHN|nr:FKBP-type peptidyl-prolyl cis-trans isomerase [Sphingomonas psychrotolerans]MDT8758919.1 FKBP-type peptidyl-prolyl cis-trans isomerase [Sphingomonas psychrotolerans]
MKKVYWIALGATGLLAATAAAALQSGGKDPSQDAAWHNQQMLALAKLKASDGWQTLPGNLRWRRIKGDGSGKHPTVQDVVKIHYAGTLVDGTEFDSSYARGEPATFPLGALIPAWQMAVPMMGVGDTIEIATPSDLAYGPVSKGPIPGGATLLFKIELLGIGE